MSLILPLSFPTRATLNAVLPLAAQISIQAFGVYMSLMLPLSFPTRATLNTELPLAAQISIRGLEIQIWWS